MGSQRPSPHPKELLPLTDTQCRTPGNDGDGAKDAGQVDEKTSKETAEKICEDVIREQGDKTSSDAGQEKNNLDFTPPEKNKSKVDSEDPVDHEAKIIEDSSIQIRDESGKVIATSGDAILSVYLERESESGDIGKIRYPEGKERNLSFKDGELSEIETIEPSANGKSRRSILTKEGGQWIETEGSMNSRESDNPQESGQKVLKGGVELYANGAISIDGTLERADGSILPERQNASGIKLALNENNLIEHIRREDDSLVECKYDHGLLVEMTEIGADGNKVTWTKVGDRWISDTEPPQTRQRIIVHKNGIVSFIDSAGKENFITASGAVLEQNENGLRFEFDENGRFKNIRDKDGVAVERLKYKNGDEIEYARVVGADGRICHYVRQGNDKAAAKGDGKSSWSLTITNASGMVEELRDWKGEIKIDDDGKITAVEAGKNTVATEALLTRGSASYAQSTDNSAIDNSNMVCTASSTSLFDMKEQVMTKLAADEGDELPEREELIKEETEPLPVTDSTEGQFFSIRVKEARDNLTELMESHLDETQKQRFEIILNRYELRAENRVEAQVAAGQDLEQCKLEWDEKLTKSYENLSKMLDPDLPNATYDLRTRAKLVECMAFSMACPVKANDQGNWGCCWMISGVFCGIIQHPDKMTDMLAQLTNTGQYTDLNGETWTPPKGLLSITDQGGNWTIENCGNGRRSPVSEILTSVAAYLSADGRRTDRGSRGGTPTACNHAMKKITGDTWTVTSEQSMVTPKMRQELLEKGGYVCIYPGHMYLAALEKHGDDWLVCASLQHGDGGRRINGTVTDLQSWNITGGRRRYNPDIDLPECQDSPTGPIGNNWPGGSARDWDYPFPIGPDPWPLLSISFALNLYDEADKRREKEREKEEEELKKKKEKERLDQEFLESEEREAERIRRMEKDRAERREEERMRRKEREKEIARRKKEEIVRRKREEFLRNDEKFRKLKALERAESLESSDAERRRSQKEGGQKTGGRGHSEQILDQERKELFEVERSPLIYSDNSSSIFTGQSQAPSWINGLRISHRPGASEISNRVELVSPVEESSPELKSNLDNTSSPSTGSSDK